GAAERRGGRAARRRRARGGRGMGLGAVRGEGPDDRGRAAYGTRASCLDRLPNPLPRMSHLELDRDSLVVVTGAGGFIGGHLVGELGRRGFERVRAVDIKPCERWYQQHPVEQQVADLREKDACYAALDGAYHVFNLACDM